MPQEKAKELFNKFDIYPLRYEWKKECAILCADEMIIFLEENRISGLDNFSSGKQSDNIKFWKEVKQEIEKL